MNTDDLDEYIEENSKSYDIFIEKARINQREKNATRAFNKRYTNERVEDEAQQCGETLSNIYMVNYIQN